MTPIILERTTSFEDLPIVWSAEKITSSNDYEVVKEVTIGYLLLGKIIEFECGLTCAIKSTNTETGVFAKWQIRSKRKWLDLFEEIFYPPDASIYQEHTQCSRFKPFRSLRKPPFSLRLLIKSQDGNKGKAIGKIKTLSYFKVIYSVL